MSAGSADRHFHIKSDVLKLNYCLLKGVIQQQRWLYLQQLVLFPLCRELLEQQCQ